MLSPTVRWKLRSLPRNRSSVPGRRPLPPSSGSWKRPATKRRWPHADTSWWTPPSVTSPASWRRGGTAHWSAWPHSSVEPASCPPCRRRARGSIAPVCSSSRTICRRHGPHRRPTLADRAASRPSPGSGDRVRPRRCDQRGGAADPLDPWTPHRSARGSNRDRSIPEHHGADCRRRAPQARRTLAGPRARPIAQPDALQSRQWRDLDDGPRARIARAPRHPKYHRSHGSGNKDLVHRVIS